MPPRTAKTPAPQTRLIIAASEADANLYWASGFLAPDPVVFIEHKRKRYLILNDLEVGRGRKEAQVHQVLSLSELEGEFAKKNGKRPPLMDILAGFLKKHKVRRVAVPYNFPLAFSQSLSKRNIKTIALKDPFYQKRMIKAPREKASIAQSQRFASQAIQEAYQVLRKSKIRGPRIYWEGRVLTSERLREVINISLMKNNCIGKHTIVAGGNDTVDPHCEGSGPLKPHRSIIMDVFPKSMDHGYFGDMSRTVVKGKASDKIRHQWGAVKKAQETGIKMIKAGVNGRKIHQWIVDFFEREGYSTGLKNGQMQGFFHGTGHGVGLDIHELPRISKIDNILKAGNVITVEPGLYYPGVGGVRIEDIVYVKKGGCEILARCPKILEIE